MQLFGEPEQEEGNANFFLMDLTAIIRPYGEWEHLPLEMRETIHALQTCSRLLTLPKHGQSHDWFLNLIFLFI